MMNRFKIHFPIFFFVVVVVVVSLLIRNCNSIEPSLTMELIKENSFFVYFGSRFWQNLCENLSI